MADVKYIKIPSDFFEREPIRTICKLPESDGIVLLYLHLLCEAYKKSRKGIFTVAQITLTDEALSCIFRYENIGQKLAILETYGLIKRNEKSVQVFKFWVDLRDRNSQQYRNWRSSVFNRDGYCCKNCGTTKNLQAHHIEAWSKNKLLRYDVSNGIALCKSCHLKAHGGSWKNG